MTVHHLFPLLPSDSPLMDRTGGLWRIASSFLRSFSTASQNPTSATGSPSSASKKPKRKKKKKNLFEVAQFLPNWGLGYRMAKTHWVGVSYQIINLYKVLIAIKFSQILLGFWEGGEEASSFFFFFLLFLFLIV
ncbi:hypothetical protein ACFX15_038103 [Malus domestica]